MADTKVLMNKRERSEVELRVMASTFLGNARFHLECTKHPNERAVNLLNAAAGLVDAENALDWLFYPRPA